MGRQEKRAAMNPYPDDRDRSYIWEMLVLRDIEAYATQDFGMVEGDFVEEGFFGISGERSRDVSEWGMLFPTLADYRRSWLEQAAETAATADMERLVDALLGLSSLARINIDGDTAVAQKVFDGTVPLADGTRSERLRWQTLYFCRRVEGIWRIAGFVGYLPNPLVP